MNIVKSLTNMFKAKSSATKKKTAEELNKEYENNIYREQIAMKNKTDEELESASNYYMIQDRHWMKEKCKRMLSEDEDIAQYMAHARHVAAELEISTRKHAERQNK